VRSATPLAASGRMHTAMWAVLVFGSAIRRFARAPSRRTAPSPARPDVPGDAVLLEPLEGSTRAGGASGWSGPACSEPTIRGCSRADAGHARRSVLSSLVADEDRSGALSPARVSQCGSAGCITWRDTQTMGDSWTVSQFMPSSVYACVASSRSSPAVWEVVSSVSLGSRQASAKRS